MPRINLKDAVKLFKETPTRVSAELNGDPIDIQDIKRGAVEPLGYGVSFTTKGGIMTHSVVIRPSLKDKLRPVVVFDGAEMNNPKTGKLYDVDLHLFKVVVEFRWSNRLGQESVLKLRVSKNPFASLLGGLLGR